MSTWSTFSDPANLDFRAACNEAAPAGDRPLNDRVFRLIHSSTSATTLYATSVASSQVTSSPVHLVLIADPRWRTLIVEAIAKDKARKKRPRDLWEEAKKWFAASNREGGSPAGKAATTVVASLIATIGVAGTSVVAIKWLVDDLKVPVLLTLDQQSPQLRIGVEAVSSQNAVPFRVSLDASGSPVPIPLKVTTDHVPVQLALAPEQQQAFERIETAIDRVSTVVDRRGQELPLLTSRVQDVQRALDKIQGYDPQTLEALKAAGASLASIDRSLGDIGIVKAVNDQLRHSSEISAIGKTITTLAAEENKVSTTQIDWPLRDGTILRCELAVKLGKVGQTFPLKDVKVTCNHPKFQQRSASRELARVGDVIRIADLPVALVVDSTARPFWNPNYAGLRLVSVTPAGQ